MDKYLVSLAFVVLFFECGWLASDLGLVQFPDQNILSHDASHSLGTITMTKHQVRKRSSESLVWEDTHSTNNVYAYDSVLTLDQSAADVKLHSGTSISLHENTLVVIEPEDSSLGVQGPVRLRFKKGILHANLGRTPQSVNTGDWVVEATAGSRVTIRSEGDDHFEVETQSGQTKITDLKVAANSQTLNAGQSIEIKPESLSEIKNTSQDLKWEMPHDGDRFYTHDEKVEVGFAWQGEAQRIALFNPKENKDNLIPLARGSGQKDLHVPLSLGNYIARLQDDKGSSFSRNISVWSAPKVYLLSPLPRERIRTENHLELFWSPHSEVSKYRWQISRDPNFLEILESGETVSNHAKVKNLPLGEYHWRVLGVDELGFQIPAYYSNTFRMVTNPLGAPKLRAPSVKPDDENLESPEISEPHDVKKDQGLNFLWNLILPQAQADEAIKHYFADFQWEPVDGATSYTIEISASADFRNPVLTKTVKHSRYKWRDFTFGKYYWRVAGIDASGELGMFSEVAKADLTTIPQGPIFPQGPVATPTPLPAQPSPSPTPQLTPTPKPVTEAPALKPQYHPNQFGIEVGADYSQTLTKGSDFNASLSQPLGVDVRLTAETKAALETSPTFEGKFEIKKLTIKPQDTQTLPFQGSFSSTTLRASIFRNSAYEGNVNYGITVLNEYPLFTRTDLETLGINLPYLVGPSVNWKFISEKTEFKIQTSLLIGQLDLLEVLASETWFFKLGEKSFFTLSLEGRAQGGFGSPSTTEYGGEGLFFLGVRW